MENLLSLFCYPSVKGKEVKFKIPYQLGEGKDLVMSDVGPRKGSGRPPRPKQVIVQALVCEKKRKFEEFEPLLDAFIGKKYIIS